MGKQIHNSVGLGLMTIKKQKIRIFQNSANRMLTFGTSKRKSGGAAISPRSILSSLLSSPPELFSSSSSPSLSELDT